MKFKLTTVEDRYDREQAEKLRRAGFSFDHWVNPTTGNEIYNILKGEAHQVYVEVDNIEGLVELQKEWGGKLILDGDTIVIYDGYNE